MQAKAGDAHAIEAVKRLVSARLFPGGWEVARGMGPL